MSEPREGFSRLLTYVFPLLDSVAHLFAYPAVGKFSRASSAGGRLDLQIKFRKSDRVGRRGLSEPREDFSRLLTDAIPRLCPWIDSAAVSVAQQKYAALTS